MRTISDGRLKEMGDFGDIHIDEHDAVTGLSTMTVLSDLSGLTGEDPGRFHLVTKGVYCALDRLNNVYFSGLLPHGGTAPLSPPGKEPPAWAIRCVLIGYPSKGMVEGTARHPLAGMPFTNEVFCIPPEMTGALR